MTPTILKYPLDRTGVNPNNFIPGEQHDLVDNGRDGLRVFVMKHGAFYTESLVIRDANGVPLEPYSDYVATYLYEDASELSGKEICEVIVVRNPNIPSPVYADYQALGGPNSFSTSALVSVLETLAQDDRPVEWANIVGRPSVFPPSRHMHAAWELFGFEPVVVELNRIAEAIYVGDQAMHDANRQYAFDLFNDGKDYTDALEARFQEHVDDDSNPHDVTAMQVGLGNVQNYRIAVETEARAGTSNSLYMTPLRTFQAIDTKAGQLLNVHIADKSNPHNVTATQVGLSNVDNFATATNAQATAGTATNLFVTPAGTKAAIAAQVGNGLSAHVNNTSNPHDVTAQQVGLGNVANFTVSNESEARAGTSNVRYMTPLRTAQAIATIGGQLVSNHANLTNNPHNVSAVQVGLGNVANYSVATSSEATAGSTNSRYMTPLRTAQAITSQVGNTLSSHVGNRSNPHGVTATQVGLGNVANFTVASEAEARQGTRSDRYMTPLRSRQIAETVFQETVTNGFNMPRTGRWSTLDFGTWETDRGYIAHGVTANGSNSGDAVMRFSVSDDDTLSGGTDMFEYGADLGGGNFSRWAFLDRNAFEHRGDVRGFSDKRLKTNFKQWDDPIGMVKKMLGGVYDRTDIDLRQCGVMAQDMLEILPEVVGYNEEEDRYSVAYGNLTAFLIEAIKALIARVESLEVSNGIA